MKATSTGAPGSRLAAAVLVVALLSAAAVSYVSIVRLIATTLSTGIADRFDVAEERDFASYR